MPSNFSISDFKANLLSWLTFPDFCSCLIFEIVFLVSEIRPVISLLCLAGNSLEFSIFLDNCLAFDLILEI